MWLIKTVGAVEAMNLDEQEKLGELLVAFINSMSHPRGIVLRLLTEMSITVPQVIVLDLISSTRNCTLSNLASEMKVSLPSISQMVGRLVKQKLLQRIEDEKDRRRKLLGLTPKAKRFMLRFRSARCSESARRRDREARHPDHPDGLDRSVL